MTHNMGCREWIVNHIRVGQQIVQRPWIRTDKNAQKRGNTHGKEHMHWSFFWSHAGVVGEKGKVRDFYPRMMEDTGRRKEQDEPYDFHMPFGGRVHDHGLADKAAKKREGGD